MSSALSLLCPARILIMLFVTALATTAVTEAVAGPEDRTRTFCGVVKRACGGHLEPQCTSGSICDAGFNSYGINVKINCPWPIPDQTITAGCYDRRPSCNDCSASGQVPCPVEAAAFCPVGCDSGLKLNKTTQLCGTVGLAGIPPGNLGASCAPGFPCKDGLTCDESRLQCVGKAKAGQSCVNPFVGCEDGLSCTGALECSNSPARLGQTCDAFNPCGDGLFCQPGLPQRCVARRVVGEGCSAFNPCVSGTSCEACFTEGCNAPFQCFPNPNEGAITAQQCQELFSPAIRRQLMSTDESFPLTQTYGSGSAIAAGEGFSLEVGTVYSPLGEYGCYRTQCNTAGLDLGANVYGAIGFYDFFTDVAGASFNIFQGVSAFEVVSFNTSQILAGTQIPDPTGGAKVTVSVDSPARLIGTADAFGLGLPSPLPVAGGIAMCTTTVDELDVSGAGSAAVLIPPPQPAPDPATGIPTGKGAVYFDGDNDQIALRDPTALAALRQTDALTVAAWINPSDNDGNTSFISKEGEYQLAMIDGELSYTIANTDPGWSTWIQTGYFPKPDQWTHVAVTYQNQFGPSDNQRAYVNGRLLHVLDGVGPIGDFHSTQNDFHIGGRQRLSGSTTYKGRVDDVQVWSRSLTPTEIQQVLDGGIAPLPGLVARWQFEELDNGVALANSAEFDILLNSVSTTATPAVADGNRLTSGAIRFDGDMHLGTDDNLLLASLDNSDTFTLEAWIWVDQGAPAATLASNSGVFSLGLSPGNTLTYELATANPGWALIDSSVEVPTEQWSHVAMAYDGTGDGVTLYLNGQPVFQNAASGTLGDTDIERDEIVLGKDLMGALDDVRLWSTARTSGDIADHFDAPLTLFPSTLLGYWRFDERDTMLAVDSSANSYHMAMGVGVETTSPLRIGVGGLPGYPRALLVDPCIASPVADEDADGICDLVDNCPLIANPGQQDSDADGVGNACTDSSGPPKVLLAAVDQSNQSSRKGSQNVVALQFAIDNNYAGSRLEEIVLRARGSGNDAAAISAVRFWHDTNNNGAIDPEDTQLGNGRFNQDNGELNLKSQELFLLPLGTSHYLVGYDF